MKKVKYKGDEPNLLPTLNVIVQNGDVIDVPDDFVNTLFDDVAPQKSTAREESK